MSQYRLLFWPQATELGNPTAVSAQPQYLWRTEQPQHCQPQQGLQQRGLWNDIKKSLLRGCKSEKTGENSGHTQFSLISIPRELWSLKTTTDSVTTLRQEGWYPGGTEASPRCPVWWLPWVKGPFQCWDSLAVHFQMAQWQGKASSPTETTYYTSYFVGWFFSSLLLSLPFTWVYILTQLFLIIFINKLKINPTSNYLNVSSFRILGHCYLKYFSKAKLKD